MSESDEQEDSDRGDAVLAIFQRGAEFTRELLDENVRLRRELGEVRHRQHDAAGSDVEWSKLREELLGRIEELESRNQTILEQLRSVEEENRHFAERCVEVEEADNNLANLYVASYQLHTTLDPGEVIKVVLEIVINLIGAEVFAVYLWEQEREVLEPVAAEGESVRAFPSVRLGDGFVGESVSCGGVAVREPTRPGDGAKRGEEPLVSIPLRVDDQVIGAIVIYGLLQHKDAFSVLDHELFTLLAGHASTAILASRLYAQSERKLNTIQGFIDLLTK
ncbi:MAG: GAF domain-containing protein [Deltaproteobacteria bacterium]|jgi:nitrate/nitrite-specific signal transduction histidine kinase|nr:GAF domain-containing protein [Deltaproteobacteria bacterium]MBW2501261.1 GAF domain-containing protein [Deltaproteobacteria bacterium]